MTVDEDKPTKTDLTTVFKKLRSYNANKVCFDCGTNNPTWASVTYGVFICIDCSAIHRGLGVHLSFVRSTQLDTNWTWLQLRAMQVGGNALATQFFRQHGCSSADSQQKYKSRAAQLYREKVHHQAVAAIRLHGTKLHIDTAQDPHSPHSPVGKDVDWFEEHSTDSVPASNGSVAPVGEAGMITGRQSSPRGAVEDMEGPSVEAILGSSPPTGSVPIESLKPSVIGQRKPPAKKLGAKKGLGAQRVKADFTEIEKKAETMDHEKTVLQTVSTADDTPAVQEISARLMVQDINKKRETLEKKISDPAKGEQSERLGMGFIGNKGQVSHSVFSDMKNVKHDSSWQNSNSNPRPVKTNNFDALDDDWDVISSYDKKTKNPYEDLYAKGDSDKFFDAVEAPEPRSTKPKSSYAPAPPAASNEAQSKFKNAKAISSDMFFGDQASGFETRTTLSRFDGQNAISSADYFGDGPGSSGKNPAGGGLSNTYYNNVPDMTDIKDSVRTGVTKVAGKLSNISSSVSSYISDNYSGY